ncbi:MAG: hypothetical protein LH679_08785 [Cyanobacteria bacterium CAN_BIN43]|nr:hypothetical protein [Cyanobacteria bacterium CAN_BIN43]
MFLDFQKNRRSLANILKSLLINVTEHTVLRDRQESNVTVLETAIVVLPQSS